MSPRNAEGPAAPDLSPPSEADPNELRRRIEAGEWVVDLRNRTAFAAGHAPGSLNFGLDGAFATYLGWLIIWGTPVTLLGETAEDIAEAQRELVRIGIDRPAAHATGGPEQWTDDELASFPTGTFADLEEVRRPPPGRHPGRTTRGRVRLRPHQRCGQHSDPRAAATDRRGPRQRAVGALRQRIPRVHRRVDARRRRAHPGSHRRHLRQRRKGRAATSSAPTPDRGDTPSGGRRWSADRSRPRRARRRRLHPRGPGVGVSAAPVRLASHYRRAGRRGRHLADRRGHGSTARATSSWPAA